MSKSFAVEFRRRFSAAFDASGYSKRQLSVEANLSEGRVSKILGGALDDSQDGPGFFGVVRLCEKLGVTPNYLAGISGWSQSDSATQLNAINFLQAVENTHRPPSVEEMSRLYMRSGGRLEAFEKHRDYFDLYSVPNDEEGTVLATHVGSKSLSAMRMGVANHIVLQEAYDCAPAPFKKRIYDSHKRILETGMTVEIDAIDERMENRPVHVKIDYLRVGMCLKDAAGQVHILIYCQLIPQ